ncbi:AlkA N-terminal domain-containing protein, partial [Streptomyces sp. SID69]|nr:DNA-3-methyladenine glycosylase 2 family protein [Streptomyces sp. SID69]
GLPVTEIAFAAGFASVRQFNDTVREVYAATPTEVRTAAPRGGARRAGADGTGIPLRLAHRGPYRAADVLDQLAREAVPGVEEVTGRPGARTYRRTLRLPYGTGIAAVAERTRAPRPGTGTRPGGWLDARLRLTDPRDLTTAVQRLRRLFDLDADPYAVDERLSTDPRLAPLVAARPGLRVPGAVDPLEAAARALLGPAGCGRLVEAYGKRLDAPDGALTHLLPEAAALARAEAVPAPLAALAAALADGTLRLDPGADRADAQRELLALPGMDPATAALLRVRALGDPDVTPPGVRAPKTWRPWRAYAVQHLDVAGELVR